jgi:hypothetical protein
MRKNIVLAIILIFIFTSLATAITPLSKKASTLHMGMSRAAVIKLLGKATWAIIPSDGGAYALQDPNTRLELHWRNPGCTTVVVVFNQNIKVTGWDEGRGICSKEAKLFNPSDIYSCDKNDRKKYCN